MQSQFTITSNSTISLLRQGKRRFLAILVAIMMVLGLHATAPALGITPATVTINVTAGPANSTVQVSLNSQTSQTFATDAQGSATATFTNVADGSYWPSVYAFDGANHSYAPSQYVQTITVDGSNRTPSASIQLRPVSTAVISVSGIPAGTSQLTASVGSQGMNQWNGGPISPVTNPSSTAQITIPDLPAGSWSITVSADTSMSGIVQVTAGSTSAVLSGSVTLAPTFTASGTVTDGAGTAMSGVSLQLSGNGGSSPCAGSCGSIVTDSEGDFSVSGLTTTSFNVTLSKTISGASVSFQLAAPANIATSPVVLVFPIGSGTVSGVVKNDSTEAPISGVSVSGSVWISSGSNSLQVMSTTNAQGEYTLPMLPPGNVSIFTYGNGYQSSNSSTVLTSGQQKTKDMYLVPNAVGSSSLSGVIRNSSSNLGISGIYVSASNVATGSNLMGIQTDGTGSYTFSNIPDGIYRVNASGVNYRFASRVVTVSGATSGQDLPLAPIAAGSASTSGVVTNSLTGSAIQGANISLWSSGSYFHATTDVNGAWSVSGVPSGTYSFYVSPPNNSQIVYDYEDRPNLVVGNSNVVRNATLRQITSGTGSITGVLKDANTHEVLAGAEIFVFMTTSSYQVSPVITNSRGEFSFSNLPAGQFMVTAGLEGYIALDLSNPEESEQGGAGGGPGAPIGTVDLEEGEAATLAGKLVREVVGPYSISGTVLTSSNRLANNTGVLVRSELGQFLGYSSTDDDGHYVISNLINGTYLLSTTSWSNSYGLADARVTISGANVTQDLTLGAAGVITGTVLDVDGNAPQCAIVTAYRVNNDGSRGEVANSTSIESDSSAGIGSGAYTLSYLAAGDYYLRLSQNCWDGTSQVLSNFASGFYSDSVPAGTSDPLVRVTVSAGQVEAGKDFTVSSNGGQISGKIVVETPQGTTGLASNRFVTVSIYKLVNGTYQVQGYQSKWVSGRDSGSFTINGLPTGSYKLKLSDPINSSRGIATTYLGGDSLANAEVLTITSGRKLYLGEIAVANKVPTNAATAVSTSNLTPATQDQIDAPDVVEANEVITVDVGEDMAGEYVTVWAHSTPTALTDWVQVGADGSVSAIVSSSLPDGDHRIVVQDVDDQVVGWTATSVGPEGSSSSSSSPTKVRVIGAINGNAGNADSVASVATNKTSKSLNATEDSESSEVASNRGADIATSPAAIVLTVIGLLALLLVLFASILVVRKTRQAR